MKFTVAQIREALKRQNEARGVICACGCGTRLLPKKYYGQMAVVYGEYSRYVRGHAAKDPKIKLLIKGRPDVREKWMEENQGKYVCQCGCGKAIKLQREYHGKGVPPYYQGHHPNSHRTRTNVALTPNKQRRKFRVAERVQILVKHAYCCALCGWGGADKVQHLEIDHILPIAKGGLTEIENGQPLCIRCHAEKTISDNRERRLHREGRVRGGT